MAGTCWCKGSALMNVLHLYEPCVKFRKANALLCRSCSNELSTRDAELMTLIETKDAPIMVWLNRVDGAFTTLSYYPVMF